MNKIFRANVDDAGAILTLQKRAYESEARLYDDWTIPPLTQTLASLRGDLKNTCVLKCVQEGEIVGSVRGRIENGACQIGRLIVEPQRQGEGIGTTLLQAIEASFPDAERFELFTGSKSERNIKLYHRCGFEIIGTKVISSALTLVYMSKSNKMTPSANGRC